MSRPGLGDGSMTVREAGQRGGRAVVEALGPEHFQRISAAGRAAWQRRSTPEQRAAISRAGAAAQRAELGADGMRAIARRGGEALLAARGRDYYAAIGRLGHRRPG